MICQVCRLLPSEPVRGNGLAAFGIGKVNDDVPACWFLANVFFSIALFEYSDLSMNAIN
jgi:hypothetical protein